MAMKSVNVPNSPKSLNLTAQCSIPSLSLKMTTRRTRRTRRKIRRRDGTGDAEEEETWRMYEELTRRGETGRRRDRHETQTREGDTRRSNKDEKHGGDTKRRNNEERRGGGGGG